MNPTPPQSSSEAIPPEDSISHYYRHSIKELRRDPAFGPGGSHFGGVVHHFLPLVYGTALKLLPEHPESAPRISQAVFELLSIKWRSLLKGRTVTGWVPSLFLWLLRATVSVSLRERKRLRLRKPARKSSAADHLALFRRFFRLSKKSQRGVLIFHILRLPPVSDYPRLDAHRKHAAKAVRTLSRKLRKTSLGPDIDAALAALVAPVPPEIESAVLDSAQRWTVKAPRQDLTRATLLNWRLLALGTFFKRVLATIGFIACLVVTFVLLAQFGYLNDFFFAMGRKETLKNFPELALLARPWPVTDEDQALVRTELPRSSADLYQATNIWIARLSFKEGDWDEIQPVRVPPVRNMFQDGRIILRNPKAERSGLSGVLGYHFNWVEAQFQFAGAWFTNVAARYRGNGTFIQSLYGPKQSFKIDLNKYTKKQALAGIDELNFVNSIPDSSYVHDALAHRLFRDLGAVGPRTAYAYLSVDVPGKWTNQPIGLYNLIENIDKDFADDRFGTKKVPIFKPVTY
ncbi:MAG: CotH kinase family protein, partial [Limisphaerales bacterium]